jgi:hypothetical protein
MSDVWDTPAPDPELRPTEPKEIPPGFDALFEAH